MNLDTKLFDTSSNFDVATNHRFTVPVTGFYQVNCQVELAQGVNAAMGTYLYKNGAAYIQNSEVNSGFTNDIAPSISALIPLTAGDYLELWMATLYGAGATLRSGTAPMSTYLSVYLVSTT